MRGTCGPVAFAREPLSFMFTQDHVRDFDAVLNAAATGPFALVRFGDGEAKLLAGERYQSADAWRTEGPSWLQPHLAASFAYVADGYCVGLPPPCCLGVFAKLSNAYGGPWSRITFATLFLHKNLRRLGEVLRRFEGACIVGSWSDADIRVPEDGVSRPFDLDAAVETMLAQERPILLAAGPLANVLVHRYWMSQEPSRRQICLDVGSALDVARGAKTRYYHEPSGPLWEHRCTWHHGAAAVSPRQERIKMSARVKTSGPQVIAPAVGNSGNVNVSVKPHRKCTHCVRVRGG